MTDTSDIDDLDPIESDLERLMAVDLSTIPATQKLGVAWCVDPDDLAAGGGGVVSQLAALMGHVTIYAGAGGRADALAIVPVSEVGEPGSLVALRAGAKVQWLEEQGGTCSWDGSKIVVAVKPRQMEKKEVRAAARLVKLYTNKRAAAVTQKHPAEILAVWDALLAGLVK